MGGSGKSLGAEVRGRRNQKAEVGIPIDGRYRDSLDRPICCAGVLGDDLSTAALLKMLF
jgi:hypothetical protein